ncbi:MAG TPA: hypothetical protein VNI57_06030, partial [Candidatus Saccharimonadales bacterium]|nr:hypothetical protein [Candidatus Saccharimonadales bacterium]
TLIVYDLLRSSNAGDFLSSTCPVAGTTDTSATDPSLPGSIFYYLVRAENVCGRNLGTRSDGTPRIAGACP